MNNKVFVSQVDLPVGKAISRLLSHTSVGCRKSEEQEDEEAVVNPDEVTTYYVSGTMSCEFPEPEEFIQVEEKHKVIASKKGTLALNDKYAPPGIKPLWVKAIVDQNNKDQVKEEILKSKFIVLDIVSNWQFADWIIDWLTENPTLYEDDSKVLVAVSTIMTWAKTKYESDDPEATLVDDDFRKRKPHPNFKNHFELEKKIMKLGKSGALNAYIVASGLQYHGGDSLFHIFLKQAWQGAKSLSIYGNGENTLPTIHIYDLANVVTDVLEVTPENKYILAVDESKHSLSQIVKAINESLGTAKIVKVSKEEALIRKDLSQADYDMLTVNIRLEGSTVKDMGLEWKYENGLAENVNAFVTEYKEYRTLTPIKILVHGPPYSGKTYYSKKLAEHYEIHYIEPQQVIKDVMASLEYRIANPPPEDDTEHDIDADKTLLDDLKESEKTTNGKFSDEFLIRFVREKIKSVPCKNQGFVLDGFPSTSEEVSNLFQPTGEEEENVEEKGIAPYDRQACPQHIMVLEVSDDVIKDRVASLPESETVGTRNAEEAVLRRIEEYRAKNQEDNNVLNFFDERDLFPCRLSVESNTIEQVLAIMFKQIGKPHNYGPSEEQKQEKKRREAEEQLRLAELNLEEKLRREKEEKERIAKESAEWQKRLIEIKKQETEMLAAQSAPLRNYLVDNVMPTLTAALIDVCKVRPDDPIDFLAEYLFRHNANNNVTKAKEM